jgi:hypothetical protein
LVVQRLRAASARSNVFNMARADEAALKRVA